MNTKLPHINDSLARQLCNMMQIWREGDYYKKPGIAETLDWGLALIALGKDALDPEVVDETLGCLFKYQDDVQRAQGSDLHEFIARAKRLADSSSDDKSEKAD